MEHPKSPAHENHSQPFIFLPSVLLVSIRNARHIDIEDIESRLKKHLTTINLKHSTRLTLGRIQRYLAKEASNFNLSQAEVSFIANSRIRDHAGSSYLSITSSELTQKHFGFINFVQRLANIMPLSSDSILDDAYANRVMGSNRNIPNDEIVSLFSSIKKRIQTSLKGLPETIWQVYNDYTQYTVFVLFIFTGHRPRRDPFGRLNNFDLHRNVVWVKDKEARENANRLLPLNKTSSLQLHYYLAFLEMVKETISYSYPAEAISIRHSLSTKENLFKLRGKAGMTLFSTTTQRECCSLTVQGASNWYRHWLRQYLAKQPNINLSALDAFMGHENLLDESFSPFSNLDVAELRVISDAIEEALVPLGLEALTVTLS
jgi:hypothetical protein